MLITSHDVCFILDKKRAVDERVRISLIGLNDSQGVNYRSWKIIRKKN